jgi:hypothetical protein
MPEALPLSLVVPETDEHMMISLPVSRNLFLRSQRGEIALYGKAASRPLGHCSAAR